MNLLSNSCQQTGKKPENGKNVSVRVNVTIRVSLVLFVSSNTFGASSAAICRRCVYKILVAFAQRCGTCVYNKSVAYYTTLCI